MFKMTPERPQSVEGGPLPQPGLATKPKRNWIGLMIAAGSTLFGLTMALSGPLGDWVSDMLGPPIVVTVRLDSASCPFQATPLAIRVMNRRGHPLKSAQLDIEAFQKGNSRNILGPEWGSFDFHRVVEAHATAVYCVVPPPEAGLAQFFTAKPYLVEFYGPDEFVPR